MGKQERLEKNSGRSQGTRVLRRGCVNVYCVAVLE